MQLSQRSFRTDLVFAAIVLTALLSIGLYGLVVLGERLAIPWWAASRATSSAGSHAGAPERG
jgi:ABC-type nitrate/sulfonate/bicarbonate transport system permease component